MGGHRKPNNNKTDGGFWVVMICVIVALVASVFIATG